MCTISRVGECNPFFVPCLCYFPDYFADISVDYASSLCHPSCIRYLVPCLFSPFLLLFSLGGTLMSLCIRVCMPLICVLSGDMSCYLS
jgi:hypothetical protein